MSRLKKPQWLISPRFDSGHPLRLVHRAAVLLWLMPFAPGCTTDRPLAGAVAESVIEAPQADVAVALRQVMEQERFPIDRVSTSDEVLETGYQRDLSSPWSWLLHWRAGVDRTSVRAELSPETLDSTRVRIEVSHEAKENLTGVWGPTAPPVSRSPERYLREVRKALGLF